MEDDVSECFEPKRFKYCPRHFHYKIHKVSDNVYVYFRCLVPCTIQYRIANVFYQGSWYFDPSAVAAAEVVLPPLPLTTFFIDLALQSLFLITSFTSSCIGIWWLAFSLRRSDGAHTTCAHCFGLKASKRVLAFHWPLLPVSQILIIHEHLDAIYRLAWTPVFFEKLNMARELEILRCWRYRLWIRFHP